MKNERLLDVFGQIDDSFIAEAAPKNNTEKRTAMKMLIKRPVTFAAVLALCICLSGVSVLAAAGVLQGYFADVFGKNDAIVGTTYEQATDEVEVKAVYHEGELLVEMVMLTPDAFPYREFEMLGIEQYRIMDEAGNPVGEAAAPDAVKIDDGKVTVVLPVNNLPNGNYKLHISRLAGEKKADQPLVLNGTWECSFTK